MHYKNTHDYISYKFNNWGAVYEIAYINNSLISSYSNKTLSKTKL